MSSKASKILGLFVLFVIGFVIFVARILDITTSDRFKTTAQKKELDTPLRGEIVTSDNYKLAISQKTYTVAVNPENIKPESFELFVKLFSIYSSIPEKELRQMLKSDKRVILVDKVDGKSAKNFRQLSAVLDKMKIFVPKTVGAKTFRYGLEIVENEFLRFYPYGDLLEPVLGYAKLETMEGLLGVEKFYDNYMSPDRVGYIQGYKDVGGNLILNEKIDKMLRSDGLNLRLNVNLGLQKQLEKILDNQKKELEADEIMAAVMDSKTGKVLSVASSNRYTQYKMSKDDFSHMKANAVQYIYEPGSTIKPIVFSILLETGKLNQYEMLKTYNGKMKIGSKIITDEHKAAYMTAEDGIVFSSNIVMSQIAQRLTPSEYIGGLQKFGFGNKSQTDIAYELKGNLPNPNSLAYEIYQATTSYGYGMRANFMQILAAYNTFNNSGIYITPKIVDKVYGNDFEERIKPEEVKRSISDMTALRMKNILKKVVEKGTGTGTKLDGLEIGGKTGTAHIAKGGSYARSYNSSFFGFANDHNSSNYTIGVLVVEPKKAHFASMTVVPVFKQIVLKMVQGGFLQAPQLLQTINAADVNKTQSTLGKDGNETTKKDPIPVQKPQKEQNKTSLKR